MPVSLTSQQERDFLNRGFSRRSFGRLAALLSAGRMRREALGRHAYRVRRQGAYAHAALSPRLVKMNAAWRAPEVTTLSGSEQSARPLLAPCDSAVCRRAAKTQTEGPDDLHDRAELGVPVRRQRLVEALPREPGLACEV